MTYSYDNPDFAERERIESEVSIRIDNIKQELDKLADSIESLSRQIGKDEGPQDVWASAGVLRQLADLMDDQASRWVDALAEANRT